MFQRLKGAIDSRIAEEQARQRASASTATPSPAARSSSSTRRANSRNDSPSARPRRAKPKDDGQAPARGPDPSEFEAPLREEVAEEPSKIEANPAEEKDTMGEKNDAPEMDGEKVLEKSATPQPQAPAELSIEVKTKLRRLENMEPRYKDLLKSYRIAHKLVSQIEPFEKALQESTPLTTISDPTALTEYLNQLNLKGDMVMDEFKRVSADRDEYKKKVLELEKRATAAEEELAKLKQPTLEVVQATEKAETASIDTLSASIKSPVSSVLGGLFSPKQKPEPTDNKDVSEEFFSYDEEIPQLQIELKEKSAAIEELKLKVSDMERDLATAQESSSGLVENLEKATRELNELKDISTESQAHQEKIQSQTLEIGTLKEKLGAAEKQIETLEENLAEQKELASKEKSSMEKRFGSEKEKLERNLQEEKELHSKSRQEMEQFRKQAAKDVVTLDQMTEELEKKMALAIEKSEQVEEIVEEAPPASTPETTAVATGAAKKKNKKKKKAGAATATETPKDEGPSVTTPVATSVPDVPVAAPKVNLQAEISKLKEEFLAKMGSDLQSEISGLKSQIFDKDAQIENLQMRRKNEDELKEKIEEIQDNYITIAQEHVEAKEKIKELQKEKKGLEEKIASLEEELQTAKTESQNSAKAEATLKTLTAEYEELKVKSSTLQTDLGAAEKLATDRYKDFTDLRKILDKAQPEMTSLRAENTALKSAKEDLATRTSELRRLEAREKDLKSDVAAFKKQAADRDNEVKSLNEKITQETNGRLKAEDQCRITSRDLRRAEADKIQFSAAGEKSASELMRVQEEAGLLRVKCDELEAQVTKLSAESKALREEVELRGEQYAKTQSLVGSMSDQAGEMAMQLKEAKSRAESFEEEMAEMQRLLSERTREGETMRRLLADVDDRADAKVREMRERMEAAIEERDRAEDEASTNGRRRAREVDELKTKIRDFERDLKRAIDDRDELSRSEKEWRRKRDELESSSETASKEVSEIRSAMGELRAALDGSEKQVREAEKQRSDLRRILDEANQRYEKLQKEFKVLQAKQSRLDVASSSRSSIDSGRGLGPTNGAAAGPDLNYLKTILLQFMQLKDKKVQGDLIKTVLGQLLQFSKQDQEKWIAVISAK